MRSVILVLVLGSLVGACHPATAGGRWIPEAKEVVDMAAGRDHSASPDELRDGLTVGKLGQLGGAGELATRAFAPREANHA